MTGTPRPSSPEMYGEKKLGKLPAKSDPRALNFARFATEPKALPARTNFWRGRNPFPIRSFGNTAYGNCTRASQAILAMRMERLETRHTPEISDEEVIRVYLAMTQRLYGGGDTGAYETDALSDWRKPEFTFTDTKGRPLTIDAFVRVNQYDQYEVKSALITAAAHGLKFCLNLPDAFRNVEPPQDWDIPAGTALTGPYVPGSWGGHSLAATDYDEVGIWFPHQWNIPDQRITWRAFAAYCDELHMIVDSIDGWRKRLTKEKGTDKALDLVSLKRAVNHISSQKIS